MIRSSGASRKNPDLEELPAEQYEAGNVAFFGDALARLADKGLGNDGRMTIGFLGQRNLPGVMLRRAQAVLRWDLRPSLWSHCFVITEALGGRSAGELGLSEVVLHSPTGAFPDPAYNAVVKGRLSSYDDPTVHANAGLVSIRMTDEQLEAVAARATWDFNRERTRYALWDTLGVWQSYFWASGAAANPLREGVPMFSSAFVEYCFEAIYLDLSPGASERNSAPEHLWNAAAWWHDGFATLGHDIAGCYVVRDRGCAVANAPAP